MEFERQNLVVSEWEAERNRRERNKLEHTKEHQEEQVIDMDTDKEKGKCIVLETIIIYIII